MKTIGKITLGLALILGLSSCGANNNQPKDEQAPAQKETSTATDPLADKDIIKLGVV